MITVKYHCDETGQEMDITVSGVSSEKAEVSINFSPDISEDTEDPFGIMGRVFQAITSSE